MLTEIGLSPICDAVKLRTQDASVRIILHMYVICMYLFVVPVHGSISPIFPVLLSIVEGILIHTQEFTQQIKKKALSIDCKIEKQMKLRTYFCWSEDAASPAGEHDVHGVYI